MAHHKEVEEYQRFTGPAESQKIINSFRGLLEGIAIDRIVDEAEQEELKNWYALYRHLMDRHPFNEILSAIDTVLADGVLTADEVQDLLWLCDQVSSGSYYDMVTSSIQVLHGVLHGILANNQITNEEIRQLEVWLGTHDVLRGTYPFDEIYSLVSSILADGVVTEDERNLLKAFFAQFIDTKDSYNLSATELAQLQKQYDMQGICAKDPDISFPGHTFCFTGTSARAKRDEIAAEILARGGIFHSTVSKKTEYLIIGADGNPCWAFSCYGRKVETAVAMREAGGRIVIVNEHDFWRALESAPEAPEEDGQTALAGFEPPYAKELSAYQQMLPQLSEAAACMGGTAADIAVKHGKNYSSVRYGSLLAFRLRLRDSASYIEVPAESKEAVAGLAPLEQQREVAGGFWRVSLGEKPAVDCAASLAAVLQDTINRLPKEWDCCSRYMECSDAKRCVHPDPAFALGCGYRKILASGKIYYGANRNV